MALLLNNDDVRSVLTMKIRFKALEESYVRMIKGEAVRRPRIDLQNGFCRISGTEAE